MMVRHKAACWSLVDVAWGVRWLVMKTSVRWRMMVKPVSEEARCGSVSMGWLGAVKGLLSSILSVV